MSGFEMPGYTNLQLRILNCSIKLFAILSLLTRVLLLKERRLLPDILLQTPVFVDNSQTELNQIFI